METAPKTEHVDIAGMFEKARIKSNFDAQTWKATASDGALSLGCARQLHGCLSGGRPEEQKTHGRCSLLLVCVVELILPAARCRASGAQYVHACRLFLQSFKNVYGAEWMTQKFHSAIHFAPLLDR